ncbi:hypothetical protein DSM3645_28472 [Blastopirellula marina DSM 3645]|uniref:Uncharacterized protein n=1 Tax=Blastopirellula marina DSM 3645 TaxID=314230 RepID=A3ZPB6_9BACT|nr:hypothetical protein DSM3645_28472 [Blastopirellula marina DSM 3645]
MIVGIDMHGPAAPQGGREMETCKLAAYVDKFLGEFRVEILDTSVDLGDIGAEPIQFRIP